MSIDIHPTSPHQPPRRPPGQHGRTEPRAGGTHHRRIPGRRRRERSGPHAGGLRRRHGERHHRFGARRVRARLGTDRGAHQPLHHPAAALGRRPRGRHGRHRPRAGCVRPRTRRHDPAQLGVAAGHAGDGGVDVRPDPAVPHRRRTLDAHPRRRRPRTRVRRRHLREHHGAQRPGHLPRPWQELPGQRPPHAPGLPRPRWPHRRALQRPRRDLRLLGQDRWPGRPDHPGLRLRPPRTGLERRGRHIPRTAWPLPRTCTPCSPRLARPAPSSWSDTRPAAPTP